MHDLIVVGAGTAGCVLAERLTASGRIRVLLIEAGEKPKSPFVGIPAGFAKLFKSKLDWSYESQPVAAIGERRIFTPRGKMLGGSANINAQIHQWCHPADFRDWESAGATGWGWSNVVPFFQSQECWCGDDAQTIRGRNGPMMISPNRNARPLSHAFVEAARDIGLGELDHYNGLPYTGAWIAELAQAGGRRFSAYDAYLTPALQRENLDVITDSQVSKVLFRDGQACGVQVDDANGRRELSSRGVVLSAGAFGTPQLLMLSGLGDPDRLSQLGIELVFAAPEVGLNLQDHPILPLVFRSKTKDTFRKAESPLSLLQYLLFKRGMLASSGAEAFAFTSVNSSDGPDLELLFLPFELKRDLLEPPSEHGFAIGSAVVAPRSRGSVSLSSRDPKSPPVIDLGLFTDSKGVDTKVILEGVRLIRRLVETNPLKQLNGGEIRPGGEIDAREENFRELATDLQTVYHPTSTCRMGSDDRAVVDPKLRVNGVQQLWIADASVMPTVPRGHPNAPIAMIAARAAEWIEQSLVS